MASLGSIGRGPPGGGEQRLPKTVKVKDKRPADRQITAEQILREAKEIRLEDDIRAPKTVITDPQELAEYRLRKRKEFEDALRRVGRWQSGVWVKVRACVGVRGGFGGVAGVCLSCHLHSRVVREITTPRSQLTIHNQTNTQPKTTKQYAQWEEGQKDFRRARSVWERALDNDYRNVTVWLKYAEMEMRHRFVNHARNVWDRAVTLLPRVDQLWYKYVHMEEVLGAVAGARAVFERWMKFEPDHAGWMAYIKFELRYDEVDRARAIFERYVEVLPSVKAWVRYAKFEMKHGAAVARARQCYERALEALGEDANTEEFFGAFAEFEEHVKEPERARAIYRYALDHLPRGAAQALYTRFVAFEKQHGDRAGIEDVVLAKRRLAYEQEVAANPLGYDAWFDYARLEEGAGDAARVRELYERAVANVPPGLEKRYWRRYVYLWVKYAVWEELKAGDMDRAREVYRCGGAAAFFRV
jgi:crooked neck